MVAASVITTANCPVICAPPFFEANGADQYFSLSVVLTDSGILLFGGFRRIRGIRLNSDNLVFVKQRIFIELGCKIVDGRAGIFTASHKRNMEQPVAFVDDRQVRATD